MAKCWKVVNVRNNRIYSYASSFEYKVGKKHNKSETEKGTPFFVFLTKQDAIDYIGTSNNVVFECECSVPYERDTKLGKIDYYKAGAAFVDSVKLIKQVYPDASRLLKKDKRLVAGMIFYDKDTRAYHMVDNDGWMVIVNTKSIGDRGIDHISCDYVNDILREYNNLTYCPNAKLTITNPK